MRKHGRDSRSLLSVAGRVVWWHARGHVQAWVVAAAGCLVSVSAVLLITGWPRAAAFWFVTVAVIWIGNGIGQSYELQRRRNHEPR